MLFLAVYILSYAVYKRRLIRSGIDITGGKSAEVFDVLRGELEIRTQIRLIRSNLAAVVGALVICTSEDDSVVDETAALELRQTLSEAVGGEKIYAFEAADFDGDSNTALYLALMVKGGKIAAMTFYNPTTGI